MKNYSIWKEELKNNNYYELKDNIYADVLIIGGGITGLSTAYHLKDSNLKVVLVEKNIIASGVSSNTTGKITYLQNLVYGNIEEYYSKDVAKMYYESQKDAINIIDKIIRENEIECDYVKQKSYLFASKKKDVENIKREKKLLEEFGENVKDIVKLPVNIHSYYGISVSNTYYFHPIKYISELAKICSLNKVKIYENTNVVNILKNDNGYVCLTSNNKKIIAKKVVCACFYPFFILPYFFPTKGHIERSYISASKVFENKKVSGINTNKNTISFRYHKDKEDNYFIYLYGSHNISKKYNILENFNDLTKNLEMLKIKSDYLWTNEDIITNDYMPYIGRIDDNLYLATGYNTWGMTNGSLAGLLISDIILNKKNKYINLFNPKREMPIKNILNVTYNLYSSAKPFVENKLIKNKPFYNKNVIFKKKNGKNIAIYIDKENKEHIVYNTCPHMKCSLIFNEKELTWDCPCHSSRFDIDGKCIKGPSKFNITYKD